MLAQTKRIKTALRNAGIDGGKVVHHRSNGEITESSFSDLAHEYQILFLERNKTVTVQRYSNMLDGKQLIKVK